MELKTGQPVASLDIQFEWHTGIWEKIFDLHASFIQLDILRSLAAGRLVVYLSCPISSRGGSISMTNIDVADWTVRRLMAEWGPRVAFVNPAQYQLVSKQGTGLIRRHAELLAARGELDTPIDNLLKDSDKKPTGGDYMRMWTRVLAEDDRDSLGDRFTAFYFIGPSDYRDFFTQGGRMSVSAGVEEYFARTFAIDHDFNAFFTPPFVDDAGKPVLDQADEWERRRREFLRFYAAKSSVSYSKGSHDEWNIWVELNRKRVKKYEIGSQIAGFFDGWQVDPGSCEASITPGYAKPTLSTVPALLPRIEPPSEATSRARAIASMARAVKRA